MFIVSQTQTVIGKEMVVMRDVDGDNEWSRLDMIRQIFKNELFRLWFLRTELMAEYKLLYVSTR